MSDKMKNLLVRAASGVVMLAVFVGAIFLSQWSFGLLMLVVALGCLHEFYRLCRKCGAEPQAVAGIFCGAAFFCVNFIVFRQFGDGGDTQRAAEIILPLLLYLTVLFPMIFVCELWRRGKNPVANVSTTLAGVAYTALPLSILLYIPLLLNGGEWDPRVMFGFMLVVWSNDVCAYLAGCTVGRHKMFERISPKKSWEGFVGGIAGAVLVGWGVSAWVGGSAAVWCGLAFVTAVAGVGGDLVESMFKRAADVKDSGSIIPGHGGWLDRFDAVLVSAPVAFVYLLFVCN